MRSDFDNHRKMLNEKAELQAKRLSKVFRELIDDDLLISSNRRRRK